MGPRLAVIPARGGSQRIPHKNIRLFVGKPIISYSIEAALESGLFDQVIVSTDDPKIAEVAHNSGAQVPFLRPADLADAFTGTNAVVGHAVRHLRAHGSQFESVCCLYATAPFVSAVDLQDSCLRFEDSLMDFLFSVTRFEFPIQRSLRVKADGSVEPMFAEAILRRSQDLEEAWHDAGQFYWGRPDAFADLRSMYQGNSLAWALDHRRVQDIDTVEEWARAEQLFTLLRTGDLEG